MKRDINSALIVAARSEIRDGLRALLLATPKVGSVNQAANALESLQVIRAQCPTLVILDVNSIRGGIQELIEEIKIECHRCRFIVLIDHAQQSQEAESAGADAVLLKGCPSGKLVETITSQLDNSVTASCG
jgi:DNA-binding NarL/FixJ family response regulator